MIKNLRENNFNAIFAIDTDDESYIYQIQPPSANIPRQNFQSAIINRPNLNNLNNFNNINGYNIYANNNYNNNNNFSRLNEEEINNEINNKINMSNFYYKRPNDKYIYKDPGFVYKEPANKKPVYDINQIDESYNNYNNINPSNNIRNININNINNINIQQGNKFNEIQKVQQLNLILNNNNNINNNNNYLFYNQNININRHNSNNIEQIQPFSIYDSHSSNSFHHKNSCDSFRSSVKSGSIMDIEREKENTDILEIHVKISQKETLVFKIRRFDDMFKTVKIFCEINKLDIKLIRPLIIYIIKALNSIYGIYNLKLKNDEIQFLKEIKKEFYHEKENDKKNEYLNDNSEEEFNSDEEYYNMNYQKDIYNY